MAKTAKGVLLQRLVTGVAIQRRHDYSSFGETNNGVVIADNASSYANGIIYNHLPKIGILRQAFPLGTMVSSGQAQGYGTMELKRVLK